MEPIENPHDKLFRETWSRREEALSLLQAYLPAELLALLDLNSLQISKDSFIDAELRDYFSDLLYRVDCAGKPGYIYILFEHKSYHERFIHLQILEYMLKIWALQLKQMKKPRQVRYLPVIIPLVLYHGEKQWSFPSGFSKALFRANPTLTKYLPDFHYVLLDLSGYSDEDIKGTVFSRVVLLLFKHRTDPNFEQQLPGILALMRNLLQQETGLQYIEIVLRYIFSALKEPSREKAREKAQKLVNQAFLEQGGEAFMTILEALEKQGYDQGMQQGMQQGMRQGLIEGLELGLNIKFGDDGLTLMPRIFLINDVTRLETLKEALKKARKLEDLKSLIET